MILSKWWLDSCHAFRQLLRLQTGKNVGNMGNVKMVAQGYGIDNSMQQSLRDLVILYKECKERTKQLMAEYQRTRKKLIMSQLQEAADNEKEEDAIKIEDILWNEAGTNRGLLSIAN